MQEKKAYVIATAHLDTVWRWMLKDTIKEFIPDTLEKNFDYFSKYSNYRFNFEGAYRYELIDEYYPAAASRIKNYVAEGKWNPTGSAYENGDVNIPSPEALIRNIMYGNSYFKKHYGKKCNDIFLPDCFGFGWALPTVMRHTGLKGFSTQKLSWGSAYGQPFDLGIWQGSDGSKVFASLDARSYCTKFHDDLRGEVAIIDKVANNAEKGGLPRTIQYYGVGDKGGAPTEESVQYVMGSIDKNDTSDFKILGTTPSEAFDDLDRLSEKEKSKLPVWNNELVMTSHGAGGYTSRAMSKRLNRQSETLADITEKALVTADILGVYKYPCDIMEKAWKRVIRHQFHDDLPGTSIMEVYNESWNDYYISESQFRGEYTGAVGAIANKLDTSWVTECAVIVNNPTPYKRKEAVEAHVKLNHNGTFIKVVDKNQNEVPSQVIRKMGKEFDIAFVADVNGTSFTVYDVKASNESCKIETDLKVSDHILENKKYRLVFNKNGDIASLMDKSINKQLLDAPIKMAVLRDVGLLNYPSWEMRKEDIDKEPICYANTPEFSITAKGPAKIAITVKRQMGYSTIEQEISMSSNGDIIYVDNFVDWQSRRAMLKATFPLSCYNKQATYDLGLGVIKRNNNSEKIYEVPAQKWADITGGDGEYGVSILSDSKYGWDKPSGNTLRLTCLHTPAGAFIKESRQDLQEIGRNFFTYGIFSHKGDFVNGTQKAAEIFSEKLTAFQTTARHKGDFGDESAINISSEDVILRALKMSEDKKGYVVRVNEANGKEQKNVQISLFKKIDSAYEIYGDEEFKCDANLNNGSLVFDLKPFEVKSFFFTVSKENSATENYKKLTLDFNSSGITAKDDMRNVILQGSGFSLPLDLTKESVSAASVTFKLPQNEGKNVFVPRGQVIDIPKGMTKMYILASSTLGDREVTFLADKKERTLTIHSMCEMPFKWDMAGLNQIGNVKDVAVGLEYTHTNHPEGVHPDEKAYFYIYEINVRNAKTLTMPEDNRIIILAMTAVKKFSNTNLASKMLDSINDDYSFGDVPPIDKIFDKTEFITIRAGKIQDQAINGKGKGFKRDNIVTNIVRSFTKSDW